MDCPSNYRYTKEHEWVDFDNGTATIGITDFAQEELGEIVFVELPEVGQSVSKGDSICVVESTKAASDVYSPVAGEVAEVNPDLEGSPEMVNQSPFEKGWMLKLSGVDSAAVEELMTAEQYQQHLGS